MLEEICDDRLAMDLEALKNRREKSRQYSDPLEKIKHIIAVVFQKGSQRLKRNS